MPVAPILGVIIKSHRVISLLEVAIFYGVALLVIWGSNIIRPPVLLVAVLLIGICVGSNRYHKDSLERVGLAKKNFWPSAKMVFPVAIIFFIPVLALAWGKKAQGDWGFWFSLLGYPVWGFAQDYALLGFVANRLEEGVGNRPYLVPWINGLLFSAAHIPNPMLMGVTFAGGTLFTTWFLRKRHLIPIAITHALFGIGLSLAFGHIDGMMSVGPAYLNRIYP